MDYEEDEMGVSDDEEMEVEESESALDSESGDDEVMLSEPSKTHVFNKEALLEKMVDISWPEKADWIHTLSIDIDQGDEVDVNDDLARELAFYTQALDGTRQAFEKLQSMGLPFLRPADYYAEMVKTDSHMMKVKSRLLDEKKKIEEAEERRKAREAKKIAKETQAQKVKERAKQKKNEIESVKKWRKQRLQSGFKRGEEAELDLSFEEGKGFEKTTKRRPGVAPGDRSGGKGGKFKGKNFKGQKGNDKKRKDKEFRDSKFGFGGKKGMKKQNTADTVNDFRQFNKGGGQGGKKRRMK